MASLYIILLPPRKKKKSMKCDVVFACLHGHSVNQATLQQLCSHFNIKPCYHLSRFVKYVLNKQDWKAKLLYELKNKRFLWKLGVPFQTLSSNILCLLGWYLQIYKILSEICWLHCLARQTESWFSGNQKSDWHHLSKFPQTAFFIFIDYTDPSGRSFCRMHQHKYMHHYVP